MKFGSLVKGDPSKQSVKTDDEDKRMALRASQFHSSRQRLRNGKVKYSLPKITMPMAEEE